MNLPDKSQLQYFVSGIDAFSDACGRAIAWLTLLMVLTQFAVVVLRYLFDTGWIALQESILFMHALVFLLGAAYTLRHEGHVRVDIFYEHLSRRRQALVDGLGTLFLLWPVCAYILWASWGYVTNSWQLLEGSREAGGLPGVFLLKTSILLMASLLALQGLSMFLKNLLIIFDRGEGD
ncbi:TRAP transporter small permease subunit [Sulfuriflexus mobilis]|uniref:TRAP transporter small permease subunit n=1 Tax=Sulfuriflexus mobilis TaxID=1811807 RepID=UPI000F82A3D5|nr:TRAP transporter small permease subunit [Sulfuriflexus mobilis]